MRRRYRILKWFGTLLCVATLFLLVYSTRRAVTWDSPGIWYELSLLSGTVGIGWRPADWNLATEKYPTHPGWSIANYGGGFASPQWWFERSRNRSWEWFSLPLWVIFVPVAIPTTILWHRDRRNTTAFIHRCVDRLYARYGSRLTFRLVLVLTTIHLALFFVGWSVLSSLYFFFFPAGMRDAPTLDAVMDWVPVCLFFGAPAWGVVWAWAYIRLGDPWLRAIRSRSNYCLICGYDLTGNVSGICPECGTPVNGAQSAGE